MEEKLVISGFNLSQTCIKALEDKTCCPKQVKAEFIDKTISKTPNENMLMGSYFEYLCLGSGATDKTVTDLTRNKDGSKKAEHNRIDQQARLFLSRFDPNDPAFMGFEIISKQEVLLHEDHRGVLDFRCRNVETGEISNWDLKFTKDIFGYGDWDWSNPKKMDLLQQVYYEWIDYKNTGEILPTYLYIADCTPNMNTRVYKINISDFKRQDSMDRVNGAWEKIAHYSENGWTTNPSLSKCGSCPLKDSCGDVSLKPTILDIEY